jgi:hypothetical protein
VIGCGRDQSWPILKHYPGTYLEGYRKNTNNMNQEIWSTNEDLTTVLPNATLSAGTVPEFNIFKETNF